MIYRLWQMKISVMIIQCYKPAVLLMNYNILPSSCCLHTNINYVMILTLFCPSVWCVASKKCTSGFGGLVVSMLASGTHVHGFNPAEAVRFFRRKSPYHAFRWRGSKAICFMSQICGM
jgi:hypothetical protein